MNSFLEILGIFYASNSFFANLEEILEKLGWFTRAPSIVVLSASTSCSENLEELPEKLGWFT